MSDYQVRAVSEGSELVELHQMVTDAFDPAVQCTPGQRFPTLEAFRSAPHLYGAYLNGRPVASAVVSERGQIGWLNGVAEHFAAAGVALIRAVYDRFGASWGDMNNPALRAALVAASEGRLGEDGTRLHWLG
jgi:hypothetical protein